MTWTARLSIRFGVGTSFESGAEKFHGIECYLPDEAIDKAVRTMVLASATAKAFIEIALDTHDMHKYFKAVLSCSYIGKGKEHPDIFLEALRILGTEREETWVFEDSYVALETASAARFGTVGIYDRYAFEQERLKNSATHYIAKGETLMKLTPFEKLY